MKHTLTRVALAGLLLVPFAGRAVAQTGDPTRAGTVITNTATASYTDANNNTYSNVTASVSVTVQRVYGTLLDPVGAGTATTAPGSTGTAQFTLTNTGNDADKFQVAVSLPGGLTLNGANPYHITYNGVTTNYASVTALNTYLNTLNLDYQGNGQSNPYSLVIAIDYTVNSGTGGVPQSITVTSTSQGDGTKTDSGTFTVTPSSTYSVTVTPDAQAVNEIPGSYTQTFTVTNSGNGPDDFNLAAAFDNTTGATITATSATTTGTMAAGGTFNVTVTYTIANSLAAGTARTLTLTATSQGDNTKTDNGSYAITVVKANLSMTKAAYDGTASAPGTNVITQVLPDAYVWYKITVTNGSTNSAPAQSISVSDPLPAAVTYVASQGDASGWTISESGGTVTATLSGTLAAGESRYFWVGVQVK